MKKITRVAVIFLSFFLCFCCHFSSMVMAEDEVFEITNGKLISVTQTVLSEGVPAEINPDEAAKLVRGQIEKISAKETRTELKIKYLLFWEKNTTLLKEVAYQNGRWQEDVLPETKTTEISIDIIFTLGFLIMVVLSGILITLYLLTSTRLTIPGLSISSSFLSCWAIILGLSFAETFLSIGGLSFWQHSSLTLLVFFLWSAAFRNPDDKNINIELIHPAWPAIFFGSCSLLFINRILFSFCLFRQDALWECQLVIIIATIIIPALFFRIGSLFAERGYVIIW